MILFQYLNALPQIPKELLIDPRVPDESKIGFHDNEYTRWAAKPELVDWLKENISNDVKLAGVQVITADVPMHCDKRKWALNYLIELGGTDVTTSFHKLPGKDVIQPPASRAWNEPTSEELFSVVLEPFKWHILNTNVLHKVAKVTGQRIAITIGLNDINPFESINGYRGLF